MFRFHALGGVSVLALLLAPATIANADHDLPAVTVDAPATVKRVARKPAPRPDSVARRSRTAPTPPQRQAPVVVANAEGSGPAVPGTPPIKLRYQLPQTSESVTARDIQEKINVVDTEDAVKYLPSL